MPETVAYVRRVMQTLLVTIAIAAASPAAYFVALALYREKQIRHARRVIRENIASACRGDELAKRQVSQASYLLNLYNR